MGYILTASGVILTKSETLENYEFVDPQVKKSEVEVQALKASKDGKKLKEFISIKQSKSVKKMI